MTSTSNTGSLTYLPGVTGPIVVSAAPDGSSFMFENTASTPAELDLWTSGPGWRPGQHDHAAACYQGEAIDVSAGEVSADGSVFVFRTDSPLPGGFNNGGGFEQVYRYEAVGSLIGVCLVRRRRAWRLRAARMCLYDNATEASQ